MFACKILKSATITVEDAHADFRVIAKRFISLPFPAYEGLTLDFQKPGQDEPMLLVTCEHVWWFVAMSRFDIEDNSGESVVFDTTEQADAWFAANGWTDVSWSKLEPRTRLAPPPS